MEIEIITERLQLDIYGFGDIATNKDYATTAFRLSGKMWDTIKSNGIKNKGMNIWLYENSDQVFAGVELDSPSEINNDGLEKKQIDLGKYASYKHVGPYRFIKQTGQRMTSELISRGFEIRLPYIEIYGHWTKDENQLETQLLMCLK